MFLNTAGNPLVSGDYMQNFSYHNLRSQLKLGIYYTGDHFDIGLALNSPSFKIFGKVWWPPILLQTIFFSWSENRYSG
jgi:hypothetical protein